MMNPYNKIQADVNHATRNKTSQKGRRKARNHHRDAIDIIIEYDAIDIIKIKLLFILFIILSGIATEAMTHISVTIRNLHRRGGVEGVEGSKVYFLVGRQSSIEYSSATESLVQRGIPKLYRDFGRQEERPEWHKIFRNLLSKNDLRNSP